MLKDFSDISLLIIAGGRSSRMKEDKRLIEIDGLTLLESILIKASSENFNSVFLCVEKRLPFIEKLASKYNVSILVDKIQSAGPMSGLAEGLKNIKTEWALTVSCDMPFFEFDVLRPLIDNLTDEIKVLLPSSQGMKQPLSAFYHNSLSKNFYEALQGGQRKLQKIIDQVPSRMLELSTDTAAFFNVNTASDLRLARGRAANFKRKVPIISIIAPASNTGKTTFIEKLIKKLQLLGCKTGVVKSDAHGFNLDVEGKDSYRFQEAGAQSVAVVSPNGWTLIQKTDNRATLEQIADKMDNVDLILTESRTHGIRPAISLYRGLGKPIINDDVVVIFTSEQISDINDIMQFDLNDIDQAVKMSLFLAAKI